jgi:hypothetical protein
MGLKGLEPAGGLITAWKKDRNVLNKRINVRACSFKVRAR